MAESAETTPEAAATVEDSAPSDAGVPLAAQRPFDLRGFLRANSRIVGATVLFALGIVFVMLGWYGTARTNILTEQIPYLISGGLLGLGLIIVAGFLATSALLEQRTDQMRQDLLRAMELMPSSAATTNGAGTAAAGTVLVLKNGHSYHSAGCPIVEGKENVTELGVREAIGKGLDMCKLCGPE